MDLLKTAFAIVLASTPLTLAACSSAQNASPDPPTPGPTTTVTGSADGKAFTALDALSATFGPGTKNANLVVGVSDTAGICAKVQSGARPKSARRLVFSDSASRSAVAWWFTLDSTCTQSFQANVASGTVTITSIDASGVTGTADVTFGPDGGNAHVVATFHTATCAGWDTTSAATSTACG